MNSITSRTQKSDVFRTPKINKIEKILIDDLKTLDKERKVPVSNSYSFKSTIFNSSERSNNQAATIDFNILVEKIEKREKSHMTYSRNNWKTIDEAKKQSSKMKISLEKRQVGKHVISKSKFVNNKEITKKSLNLKVSDILVKNRSQASLDFPVINYKLSNMKVKNVKKDILMDFIKKYK